VDYLTFLEAISVKDYKRDVIQKLTKIEPELRECVESSLEDSICVMQIVDILNSNFRHDDIKFFFIDDEENQDGYVASAETNINTKVIEVSLGIASIFDNHPNFAESPIEWLKSLTMTITHELIHREQITRSNKGIKPNNEDSFKDYLANRHEIQTQAKDAIDLLAIKYGIEDEELIDFIQQNIQKLKREIRPIRDYWVNFGSKSPKEWKKFLKYLSFYALDH
jgi:hypothetical protein